MADHDADEMKISCFGLPDIVNSMGFFSTDKSNNKSLTFLTYGLPLFHLQLTVIFLVTQATHFVLKRIGVTTFVSQMVAGIILGPSLFGRTHFFRNVLFPQESQKPISVIAAFGYISFMFTSGIKMDISMVSKTGKKAMILGIAAILLPVIVFQATYAYFGMYLTPEEVEKNNPTVMLAIQAAKSFPVIASLLTELKVQNSELGRIALSAALISDFLTSCLVIATRTFIYFQGQALPVALMELVEVIVFVLFLVFIFRPAMFWIVKRTPKGRPVKEKYIFLFIAFMLAFVVICEMQLGMMIIGSVLLGLVVPAGPPLGSALENKLEGLSTEILFPLQATISAMRMESHAISFEPTVSKFVVALVVLTFFSAVLSCYAIARYCKLPQNDAAALAFILGSKGIIELSSFANIRDQELITTEIFTIFAMGILVVATIVPILVRNLYDPSRKYGGYQKRNVMHLKYNDELKVLSCIHRPDNVSTAITLLDAFCPSKDCPVNASVLHLMEQIGRASPVFISHQIQTRTASNYSYSGDVVHAFTQYLKSSQPGTVAVNVFTAISEPSLMSEDICRLALDKLTNLIILPFHQKRLTDGVVESESTTIRSLNNTVLNGAPCSVGILVDNGHLGSLSRQEDISVGMIFLGGKDDAEALTISKRMAVGDEHVSLTVLRGVAPDVDSGAKNWENVVDKEVLADFRMATKDLANVTFEEKMVNDGIETLEIVKSMLENEYDLFIVGRRQSVQLAGIGGEWSEYPELGTFGDILASIDFNRKASVLVVQQQMMAEFDS